MKRSPTHLQFNSNIRAVWFDMDGTILTYETLPNGWSSWSAIGWAGNIYEQMEIWIEDFLAKRITDEEIWGNTSRALQGLSYAQAAKILFPEGRPPYNPNFLKCVEELRPRYRLGIISGGIDLVAEQVRKELNLEFQLSNTIGVSNGYFDGTFQVGVPFYDKITSLKKKAKELDLDLAEICFVGDSVNDVECLKEVGLPIAYRPRYKEVTAAAKGNVIEDFDQLPAFIQNYSI